jgi:hypothetical protein
MASLVALSILRVEDLGKRPPASMQALIEAKAVYFFVRL